MPLTAVRSMIPRHSAMWIDGGIRVNCESNQVDTLHHQQRMAFCRQEAQRDADDMDVRSSIIAGSIGNVFPGSKKLPEAFHGYIAR